MLVCVDTLAPGSRRAGRTACIARTRQLTDSPSTPINATCQHAARQRARSPCAQLSPIAGCSTAHTVCANAASIAAASCSVKTTNGDPSQSRSDRSPAGSSLVRAASTEQTQEESAPRPQGQQEEERSRRSRARARTRASTSAGTRPGARPQSVAAAAPKAEAAPAARDDVRACRIQQRRQGRGPVRRRRGLLPGDNHGVKTARRRQVLVCSGLRRRCDGNGRRGCVHPARRRRVDAGDDAAERAQTTPAPELDGLVAYSKGGAPAPAEPRTSHAASLTAKPRPRSRDDDDDDDDAFDPVQSVDDWKKAAPKPRRPAVARPDIAARKAQQAEKNEALRRAEINRKKKEKKKAKKIEVREHFRQAL